jgi:1,4-dihydroxy-2-naphthoate octaprenyltransferase
MTTAEPTLAALRNPLLRYFLATRPAFFSVTVCAYLLGLAAVYADGIALTSAAALLTILFALLVHAGVNVLNDYYDALNGTDELNTERVFPYTGGSRFIQNGVLTPRETARFGTALLALGIAGGLWLTALSGPGLLLIGAFGLVIGWAYSAPPLALNSRGVGEACVAAGFLLIVIGTDYVQRAAFSFAPVLIAMPYALLVTNVLYINQFPDRRADAAAGKRHWVVRLHPNVAVRGYVGIAIAAYAWLVAAVISKQLPAAALAGLLPGLLSWRAASELWRFAAEPQRLAPAIRATIAAACLHGLLVAAAIAWSRPSGS